MEETKEQPNLMKHAIRWGFIVSAVSIFLTVSLYVIDYTLMVQLKFLFLFLAIYLGIVIYAGIEFRKSIGGFLSYGKAFQHGFIILAVSGLIATIFAMLLYHVIDPDLPQKLTEASLENTRVMMEKFGAPADAIDKGLADAEERTKNQFTISGQLMGYVFILIFSAIMAAIGAFITRKNEPVEV